MKKISKKGVYDAIKSLDKAHEVMTIEFEGGWRIANKVEPRTSTIKWMDGSETTRTIYQTVEIDITDPEGNTRDIELFYERNAA